MFPIVVVLISFVLPCVCLCDVEPCFGLDCVFCRCFRLCVFVFVNLCDVDLVFVACPLFGFVMLFVLCCSSRGLVFVVLFVFCLFCTCFVQLLSVFSCFSWCYFVYCCCSVFVCCALFVFNCFCCRYCVWFVCLPVCWFVMLLVLCRLVLFCYFVFRFCCVLTMFELLVCLFVLLLLCAVFVL